MKTYYNGPQRRKEGTPPGQMGEQSTRGTDATNAEIARLVNRRNQGKPDEMRKDKDGNPFNYTIRVLSDAMNRGVIDSIPAKKTK